MRKLAILVLVLGIAGLIAAFFLSAPATLAQSDLPDHTGDAKNGKYIFHAGGCGSCHAAPKSKDKTKLPGGLGLHTPFGTFYAPNISSDKQGGIGGWSILEFVNAMMRGVSPGGSHYYPAFPYSSYQRMRVTDVIDLKAYLDTLPAVKSSVPDHDLALPFRLRRGLGLWKLLFMDYQPFKPNPKWSAEINRGAYLVQGPGHCGECHTPRNLAGGKIGSRQLAGGPAPEGDSDDFIPNITPHKDGIGAWSLEEIVEFLESGDLPDGDVVGGIMVDVQENMAVLSDPDRRAIAAYLKVIKPVAKR